MQISHDKGTHFLQVLAVFGLAAAGETGEPRCRQRTTQLERETTKLFDRIDEDSAETVKHRLATTR